MTTTEAKTKMCPFVGTFNLTSENIKVIKWETTRFICCADKCMAWEWLDKRDETGFCKRVDK